jgi:hypothetical protein
MDARGRIMPDVRTDFQLNVWPPPTNYLHRGGADRILPGTAYPFDMAEPDPSSE